MRNTITEMQLNELSVNNYLHKYDTIFQDVIKLSKSYKEQQKSEKNAVLG